MEILSLGEKIKRRRKELNMTLKELAGERITPGQISLVESGRSNPSMDLLEYIAITLNTSVEYLMETEKTQAEKICLYYEQIAEGAILNDDIKKGEKFIEYAIYYADKYDLVYRKAKNLALKAEIYLKNEEYVLAQQYFLSANMLFLQINSNIDMVKTYLNIAKISLHSKAYYSANSYLREAEKIYVTNKLTEDLLLGEIYYLISKTYFFIENLPKAINFAFLAKSEFEKVYNKKAYAKSLELLAEEHAKVGDLESAIAYSKQSLNVYKELEQLDKISSIEDSLGKLFFEFDNIEESFEHYNRAMKIREENTDSKLLDTLFNLCENHIKTKNMTKCIEILNEIKNKLNISDVNRLIEYKILTFRIEVLQNNIKEAENILLDTLEIAKRNDMKKKEANISIRLGKFYLELKRDYEAAKYLDKGINNLKNLGVIKS